MMVTRIGHHMMLHSLVPRPFIERPGNKAIDAALNGNGAKNDNGTGVQTGDLHRRMYSGHGSSGEEITELH